MLLAPLLAFHLYNTSLEDMQENSHVMTGLHLWYDDGLHWMQHECYRGCEIVQGVLAAGAGV